MDYKQLYFDAFEYFEKDFVPSEISGSLAVDIHHIEPRGMGGTNNVDRIENLIALTREEHVYYGDKKQHKSFLYRTHYRFLDNYGVKFDKEYILKKIQENE